MVIWNEPSLVCVNKGPVKHYLHVNSVQVAFSEGKGGVRGEGSALAVELPVLPV